MVVVVVSIVDVFIVVVTSVVDSVVENESSNPVVDSEENPVVDSVVGPVVDPNVSPDVVSGELYQGWEPSQNFQRFLFGVFLGLEESRLSIFFSLNGSHPTCLFFSAKK